MLAPKVSVPVPVFSKVPVSPLANEPENVVDELLPPAIRVPEPSVIVPAPAIEPIVSV